MASPLIQVCAIAPVSAGKFWESSQLLRIGRAANLEITLTDPSVSRCHAEVSFDPTQGWCLQDVGSTNGTFLNGDRLGPAKESLEALDVLQLGNAVLLVGALDPGPTGDARSSDRCQVRAARPCTWEDFLASLALNSTMRTPPAQQLLCLLRAKRPSGSARPLDDWIRLVSTLERPVDSAARA